MGCGPISTELSRSPDKRRRKGPRPRPDLSARSQRRCARGLALPSAEESISMRIKAPARLAVAWLTMFLVGTELFVFSPLLPVLATDYHIAPSLAGLSVTMFSVAYMISVPLFGYILDPLGRRRVLIRSLLALALANILTAGAANLPCLLAVRLFAGAAAAGVSPSIYALVGSAAPPDRRATWLALVVSGLLVSLAIGASAGGLVGSLVGGPPVFLALAGLGLVLVWLNRWVWPCDHDRAAGVIGAAASDPLAVVVLVRRLIPMVLGVRASTASIPTSAPASLPSASRPGRLPQPSSFMVAAQSSGFLWVAVWPIGSVSDSPRARALLACALACCWCGWRSTRAG